MLGSSSRRDSFYSEPDEFLSKSRRFSETVYRDAYGSIARSVVSSDGESILAETLWHSDAGAGAVVFVVRRTGCPLCRAQALLIAHCRDIFRKLGFETLAIVNCETGDATHFEKRYWGRKIFVDPDGAFSRLLGGGSLPMSRGPRDALSIAFLRRLFRSLCVQQVRPSFAFLDKMSEPILGGSLLVLPNTQGVCYIQRETSLGGFGDLGKLIRAAYRHSPHRHRISPSEVEEAIRAHHRRMHARLRRLPSRL